MPFIYHFKWGLNAEFEILCVPLQGKLYLLSRDSFFRSTHFTINIRSKIFQNKAVRLVHHTCVKRCEIDARGLFRIMSHAFADD